MEDIQCPACNSRYEKISEPFDYSALAGLNPAVSGILLFGIPVYRCECGLAPQIPNVEGLHTAIVCALLEKDAALDPSELRFIRKTLRMTQKAFSGVVGVTDITVCNWESGKQRPDFHRENSLRVCVLVWLVNHDEFKDHFGVGSVRRIVTKLTAHANARVADRKPTELTSVPPAWICGRDVTVSERRHV